MKDFQIYGIITDQKNSGNLSKKILYQFAQDAVDYIITLSTALVKA